jgi:hypothetical protein
MEPFLLRAKLSFYVQNSDYYRWHQDTKNRKTLWPLCICEKNPSVKLIMFCRIPLNEYKSYPTKATKH